MSAPRRAVAALTVVAVAAVLASPAEARLKQPPQGVYEGCSPGATLNKCRKRLHRIGKAGFRIVLNYSAWYGTPAELGLYAQAARRAGVKLIWPLNHPSWRGHGSLLNQYERLTRSCECRNNAQVRSFAIRFAAGLPATWGFYTGDEVAPVHAAEVALLSWQVRYLAPFERQLYVARPGAANLLPFLWFGNYAGADVYPVGSNDPPVAEVARLTRRLTRAHGRQTVLTLQAFSWSQYFPGRQPRFPSRRLMRGMRNSAIRHGHPDLILWYSYQDIANSSRPRRNWRALRKAAFGRIKRR